MQASSSFFVSWRASCQKRHKAAATAMGLCLRHTWQFRLAPSETLCDCGCAASQESWSSANPRGEANKFPKPQTVRNQRGLRTIAASSEATHRRRARHSSRGILRRKRIYLESLAGKLFDESGPRHEVNAPLVRLQGVSMCHQGQPAASVDQLPARACCEFSGLRKSAPKDCGPAGTSVILGVIAIAAPLLCRLSLDTLHAMASQASSGPLHFLTSPSSRLADGLLQHLARKKILAVHGVDIAWTKSSTSEPIRSTPAPLAQPVILPRFASRPS